MKKHVICGYFGQSDKPSIAIQDNYQVTYLDLLDRENHLSYGIGNIIDDLESINVFPSSIGVELLILAAHVQAADTRISRTSESQDSWTREITLIVPIVGDIDKWKNTSAVLKRALDFLTGDLWNVEFRKSMYAEPFIKQQKPFIQHSFDSLSLFSGGLDSLIGAIDLLEHGKKPLFISHASEGATSAAQHSLFSDLKQRYQKNELDRIRLWMSFPKNLVGGSQPEMTMRSRSFLFFALGVVAGTGFLQKFTLLIPENGLIALNVPLDPLRIGSHSTHTTHPFYIARWNEFINILDINGELINPYWNKTKGEMVEECHNKSLLSVMIPNSLSCSSPSKGRWDGEPNSHCGYCVPCIIRRAAINASSITDNTVYSLDDLLNKPLDTKVAQGRQIRSFQLAIKRLEDKPSLAEYLIYTAGSLIDVSADTKTGLAHVYARGLKEASILLDSVIAKPLT